ncbi:MAG: hypothetical protein Q8P41_32510 [Pseudomonadota bacterium]|nr:hypothetical protein [Pseudomonadota bacterium]
MTAVTAFDAWIAGLRLHRDTVLALTLEFDLANEARLAVNDFAGFLDALGVHFGTHGDVDTAWRAACAAFALRGPVAPVGTPVVRVFVRTKLAGYLATVMGFPASHGEVLVDDLLASQDPAALGGLRLGGGAPIWGGLDPAHPSAHPCDRHPTHRLLDLLGLDPTFYPRSGERFVILRYVPPDPRIPTVPDAGPDNPYWMPAPATEAWGRARDITGLSRGDLAAAPRIAGLGEVVHDNCRAADVVVPGTFARESA